MKRYFAVVSMMCLFALAGIAGAVAQEVQKANPATDFEYDLNEAGDGVIITNYKGMKKIKKKFLKKLIKTPLATSCGI